MFMGTYYNSIDAKNRMIVPSKHREQLGGRCVLTIGMDTCLYIYPMSEWEKQVEKMSQLPETDPNVRKFIRNSFCVGIKERQSSVCDVYFQSVVNLVIKELF